MKKKMVIQIIVIGLCLLGAIIILVPSNIVTTPDSNSGKNIEDEVYMFFADILDIVEVSYERTGTLPENDKELFELLTKENVFEISAKYKEYKPNMKGKPKVSDNNELIDIYGNPAKYKLKDWNTYWEVTIISAGENGEYENGEDDDIIVKNKINKNKTKSKSDSKKPEKK